MAHGYDVNRRSRSAESMGQTKCSQRDVGGCALASVHTEQTGLRIVNIGFGIQCCLEPNSLFRLECAAYIAGFHQFLIPLQGFFQTVLVEPKQFELSDGASLG